MSTREVGISPRGVQRLIAHAEQETIYIPVGYATGIRYARDLALREAASKRGVSPIVNVLPSAVSFTITEYSWFLFLMKVVIGQLTFSAKGK